MEKDWSNLSDDFDDLQRLVTGEAADKIIKLELSQLRDLGDLLELGCGNGNYTKSLVENSTSILCTDVSQDMVCVAAERLKDFSNVRVQQADCYDTGLGSGSFDTVFMANLIHVVSEPEKAIREAHRLLRENGRIVVVSFTVDGMSFIEKIKLGSRYIKYFGKPAKGGTKFSLKMLEDFVADHSFNVEEVKLLGERMSKAIFLVARKVSERRKAGVAGSPAQIDK